MKRLLTPAAAALLFIFGFTASAADGTFEGEAQGHNDAIHVAVTVEKGHIKDVKILKNFESPGVSDLPKAFIPKAIVDHQTLKVDRVSGATFTSMGILSAVSDALKKAGLDPAQFRKGEAVKYAVSVPAKSEADVVIIGGGGAGMSAAVAAARKGANVIVLEKMPFLGGNTILAGGALNAADEALESKQKMSEGQMKLVEDVLKDKPRSELHKQLQAKISADYNAWIKAHPGVLFDSPEFHALQTWKDGDYEADLALIYEMTQHAPETVVRLSKMGLDWNPYTSQYVGALWPRSHDAANYHSGLGYLNTYRDTIEKEKLPVKVYYLTRANELIKDNGRVVGVKAKDGQGKDVEVLAKKGVVLATGGFGANIEMRMKYDQLWDGKLDKRIGTTNSRAITGDGIPMAEKAGAKLVGMGYIQLLPVTDPTTGQTIATCEGTALYVNNEGKRFVNEMERRDVLSKAAIQQPGGTFWRMCTVKNARVKNGITVHGLSVESLIKAGKLVRGETVEELAKKTNIDPKVLKKTFDEFNSFCRGERKDTEFNRPSCSPTIPMYEGPYYAEPRKPSVHHTMGGVAINTNAQVLDTNGKPIPGLYAAGEVTGGLHGKNRIGGNAIADALTFGNIAGISASQNK